MGWTTATRCKLYSGKTRGSNLFLRDSVGPRSVKHHKSDKNHNHTVDYKFDFRIYPVILALLAGAPAFAEGGDTQAIANPQSVSQGNVTNQAVQVVNGQYFQQTYGAGVQCQGTTLVVAPFAIQGFAAPESQVKSDYGISVQVSIPLDREAVDQCKERARIATERQRAETDKAQLDYQLVRSLKCVELIQKGGFIHPQSPYAPICADVIAQTPDGTLRNGVGAIVGSAQPQTSNNQPPSSSESDSKPALSEVSIRVVPDQTVALQTQQPPSPQSSPQMLSSQQ